MKFFKRKAKAAPKHAIDEATRDTMRMRQRDAFNNYAFYIEGERFQVTSEPTFNAQARLIASSSEGHALTYAHYKLNQFYVNGHNERDVYVWDLAASTQIPFAHFHYNETTHEVERT